MQKFILFMLAFGLALFLYLLQSGQISREDFNIQRLRGDTEFIIKKIPDDGSAVKNSDIYAVIRGKEFKVFTFSGNDFHKLFKYEFPDLRYKVPLEATDAVTGTWIGNRYVFYMIEAKDIETEKKIYEIYKTEYTTDDISKLKYYKIKSVNESDVNNSFEVKY